MTFSFILSEWRRIFLNAEASLVLTLDPLVESDRIGGKA